MSNYLKFNSRSKIGRCLSNFSNYQIHKKNKIFITGEHCFHYMKYYYCSKDTTVNRKKELLKYASNFEGIDTIYYDAKNAKKAGGKKGLLLLDEELINWNKFISEKVQKKICKYKAKNYIEIKKILIENKDKILIHQDNFSNSKTIWGGKVKDGKIIGNNKLGKIWMKIQKNLN